MSVRFQRIAAGAWRRHKALLVLGPLTVAVFLMHSRRPESERWMDAMRAHGEKFTVEELGLRRTSRHNPLAEELGFAGPPLARLNITPEPRPHPGFQAGSDGYRVVPWTEPWLYTSRRTVLDWDAVQAQVGPLDIVLADLHEALRDPPRDPGWSYGGPYPNLSHHREIGLHLHTLLQVELHRGQLGAAHSNLLSLIRLGRAYEEGWTLVHQMIRCAMVNQAADGVWQALQAPGWTDFQLAQWQRELEAYRVIPQLARALEAQRASDDEEFQRYAREGPRQFLEQYGGYGQTTSLEWKVTLAFDFWKVFRAGRDRLRRLEASQATIENHRALARGTSYREIDSQAPPPSGWMDGWLSGLKDSQILFPFAEPLRFNRMSETVVGNDAHRLLALTAVGLERYRLRHGHYPASLERLVPEFLDAVPRDAWSGQALHYQRRQADPPLLYSLGPNGQDDTLGKDGRPHPSSPRTPDDAEFTWSRPLILVSHPPPPPPWALDALNARRGSPAAARSSAVAAGDPVDDPVLPLVQFEECPLRDAVSTLARQANLIYVVDPAVDLSRYPAVSIRLENVTAGNVLEAIVSNNGLLLEQDRFTGVCRLRQK